MKLPEAARGVIEDAIQHHANFAPVRFIQEEAEPIIAAEKRVDVVVIVGVITMVGSRSKYGVEV
jgi:hypothetical protein